ncbi:MAG: hypothetical protein JRJ85_05030 [Deltaproteobacteria bacterium]|nr:hypothetical protein [Deltaproteobacteria bacterium]
MMSKNSLIHFTFSAILISIFLLGTSTLTASGSQNPLKTYSWSYAYPYEPFQYKVGVPVASNVSPMHHGQIAIAIMVQKTDLTNGFARHALLLGPGSAKKWFPCEPPDDCRYEYPAQPPCDLPPGCQLYDPTQRPDYRAGPYTYGDTSLIFLRFFGNNIFAGVNNFGYNDYVQVLSRMKNCGGKIFRPFIIKPSGILEASYYAKIWSDEAQTFFVYKHPFDVYDSDGDGDYDYRLATITAGLDPQKYEELEGNDLSQVTDGVMWWQSRDSGIATFTNTSKVPICRIALSREEILGYGHGTVVTVTKNDEGYVTHDSEIRVYPGVDSKIKRPISTDFVDSISQGCLINRNGYIVVVLEEANYPLCYIKARDMQSRALKFDPWEGRGSGVPYKVYLLNDNTLLWSKTFSDENGPEFLIQEADLDDLTPTPKEVFRGSLVKPDSSKTKATEYGFTLLGADEQGMFIRGGWYDDVNEISGGSIFWIERGKGEHLTIEGKVVDKEVTECELSGVAVTLYLVGQDDPVKTTFSDVNGTFVFYDVKEITYRGDNPYVLKTEAGLAQCRTIPPATAQDKEEHILSEFYLPAEKRTKAGSKNVIIELIASPILNVKRTIADSLIKLSSNNYKPTEENVIKYLTELQDRFDDLQDKEIESIKRAIVAEKIVQLAAFEAQEILRELIKGLVAMIVDLTDDLIEFQTKQLELYNRLGLEKKLPQKKLAKLRGHLLDKDYTYADLLNASINYVLEVNDNYAKLLVDYGVKDETKRESIKQALTFFKRGLKTLNNLLSGKKFNLGSALSIEGWVLNSILPDLFDNSVFPSYCSLTKPNLDYSYDKFTSWQEANENILKTDVNLAYQKLLTISRISGEALVQIGYAQDAAGILDSYDDLATPIGEGLVYTGVLAGFGRALKASGKAAKYSKYLGHFKAFVDPIVMAFVTLPEFVEEGVHEAWHDPIPKERGTIANRLNDGLRGRSSSQPIATDFLQNLRNSIIQAKTLLDTNLLDALSDHLLADTTGTMDLLSQAYERLETEGSKILSIISPNPLGPTEDIQYGPGDLVGIWNVLIQSYGVANELLILYMHFANGAFGGTDDFRYIAAKNSLIQFIDDLAPELDESVMLLEAINSHMNQLAFHPLVVITSPSICSLTTDRPVVSDSPESFTIAARVRNLSSDPVSNLSARLSIITGDDVVQIDGSDMEQIGLLAADDGINFSGADEAAISFTITYHGSLTADDIQLQIAILENGTQPASFNTYDRFINLNVDRELLDQDFDGMPDNFETKYSLNINSDDSQADNDGDNLINIDEFRYGTDPRLWDTDYDGLSDREEIEGGQDGFITDPLNPDSDGDGTNDGADGSPLDPESTDPPQTGQTEPQVGIGKSAVFLNVDTPETSITISNKGTGKLYWLALNSEPTLIDLYPESGEEQDTLTIKIKDTVSFDEVSSYFVEVPVGIMDLKGSTKDIETLTVIISDKSYSSVVHVRLDGVCSGLKPCASSIQGGVEQATSGALIKISAETYNEDIVIAQDKTLTIKGGWDSQFSTNTADTIVDGSLRISNGSVIIENVIIR